jgi:glycosyltransferase involved in cell wall biosynthesis
MVAGNPFTDFDAGSGRLQLSGRPKKGYPSSGEKGSDLQLCVVIPARDESSRLARVVQSLPHHIEGCGRPMPIVVNDGSVDDTATVVQDHAVVVSHAVSKGKGAALKTGCDVALEQSCDILVMMDGDGQHEASDLPSLVRPLIQGEADVSLGFRRLSGQMPVITRAGNLGLSSAFAALFGRRFHDTQCGFRAFTARAYEMLRWRSNGYSVETEMLIRAVRCHLRVAEVPVKTIYHDRSKGTTMADGLPILVKMLRWRLSR